MKFIYYSSQNLTYENNLLLKKLPSTLDKDIKQLGQWLSHQKQNYKNKKEIMKNEDIYNIWKQFIEEYNEYSLSNEEFWMTKFEKVKQYINENKKKPTKHNKDKDIKQLGQWLSSQKQNYKNKKNILKNENVYNTWKQFIEEYNEYF